ncbi:hypothetical protein [Halopiger goleimassiliensis]|uniref:hypothetical protein n=1 Tax=Halopiger goleimassiliensis TaxID=1293048 RepID=UPI0012B5B8DC|nr:hypothetical protein [Halopiger goleimassiliensis]
MKRTFPRETRLEALSWPDESLRLPTLRPGALTVQSETLLVAPPIMLLGTNVRIGMAPACANCGVRVDTVSRHHVYLETDEVVELELCEGCRYKFVTAEWVTAVV